MKGLTSGTMSMTDINLRQYIPGSQNHPDPSYKQLPLDHHIKMQLSIQGYLTLSNHNYYYYWEEHKQIKNHDPAVLIILHLSLSAAKGNGK